MFDLFMTLWPRANEYGLPCDQVGDLDTLATHLDVELDANESFATTCGYVGAYSRRQVSIQPDPALQKSEN
jgi:hypothetical protein